MATYWQGNKKISKAEYDATQAKNTAWKAGYDRVGLDAMQPARQPSGKQPVPTLTASNPLGIIDVRKNLDTWTKSPEGIAAAEEAKRLFSGSSGKQPDTSALNAFDQDTLRRLQEEADRKRMEEQFEAAVSHGKEIVFEFSKPISSKASTYVSKLVKLLGGKRSYIENQTKLVVVM